MKLLFPLSPQVSPIVLLVLKDKSSRKLRLHNKTVPGLDFQEREIALKQAVSDITHSVSPVSILVNQAPFVLYLCTFLIIASKPGNVQRCGLSSSFTWRKRCIATCNALLLLDKQW